VEKQFLFARTRGQKFEEQNECRGEAHRREIMAWKSHSHFSRTPQECNGPLQYWRSNLRFALIERKPIMQKRNLDKMPNPLLRILSCYIAVFMIVPGSMWAQLTINPPTFPTTNTVRVTLSGTESTNAHIILWTPELVPDIGSWYRVTTGSVGQVSFDFTLPTNQNSFFAAGIAPISTPTVATPVFTPGGGSYAVATNVAITCATGGALIYYTTNGSTPTVIDNYISSAARF
jgi:Chitobiase/beta-hexosaminidase C-terminal domain